MIEWDNVIAQMPGLVLEDQQPQGSGIVVSIEARGQERWVVHCAREEQGSVRRYHTKPLDAEKVYKALERFYREAGYVPEISEGEQDQLGLPRLEALMVEHLPERMPGEYLGAKQPGDELIEWVVHYSLEKKPNGRFTLYSCGDPRFEEDPSKLYIEEMGTFTYAEILEELREIGFSPQECQSLTQIEAASLSELKKKMPGEVFETPAEAGCVVSILQRKDQTWTLFLSRKREGESVYEIEVLSSLEALEVYRTMFDQLGWIPMERDLHRVKLPRLETLYEETLMKKMKGELIGGISTPDEHGLNREVFVALKRIKEEGWLFQFVRAEDLLAGEKKFMVHKLGPLVEENVQNIILQLEAHVDPVGLLERMSEHKNSEIRELAKRLILFFE